MLDAPAAAIGANDNGDGSLSTLALLDPERPCRWPAKWSTLVCCVGCGFRLATLFSGCLGLQLIRAWDDRSAVIPAFCRPCGRLPVSVPFDVFPLGSTTLEL